MNQDITCEEVKERLDSKTDFNFVDVREQWEYDQANLGAKLIPLGELPQRIDEISDWKHEEVVIHCKSGARSGKAKQYLNEQGFTNVRNMTGGILAYKDLG